MSIKPGSTKPAGDLGRAPRKPQSSKYDDVIASVLGMRPNTEFSVNVPRNTGLVAFRNNLASAIRRKLPSKLKGKIRCHVVTRPKSVVVSRIK